VFVDEMEHENDIKVGELAEPGEGVSTEALSQFDATGLGPPVVIDGLASSSAHECDWLEVRVLASAHLRAGGGSHSPGSDLGQ
jgi:hypothetical protein